MIVTSGRASSEWALVRGSLVGGGLFTVLGAAAAVLVPGGFWPGLVLAALGGLGSITIGTMYTYGRTRLKRDSLDVVLPPSRRTV